MRGKKILAKALLVLIIEWTRIRISLEQRFFYLLKPHRSILLQVLVGAIFYTISGLSTSIFLQKIVDNVLPDGI